MRSRTHNTYTEQMNDSCALLDHTNDSTYHTVRDDDEDFKQLL